MVRKIFHIAIIVILMISTMGFSIRSHYCGEKLVDISLIGDVDLCCDMQNDCCHDELQIFQLEQDYQTPIVINQVDYFAFVTLEIVVLLSDFQDKANELINLFSTFESPPIKKVSQFICDIQVYRL